MPNSQLLSILDALGWTQGTCTVLTLDTGFQMTGQIVSLFIRRCEPTYIGIVFLLNSNYDTTAGTIPANSTIYLNSEDVINIGVCAN